LDPRQIVVAQYFSQILSPDALPGFEKSRLGEQTQKLAAADVTIASSCTNSGLLARGFVEKGN
jgi:hypothetical protein